MQNSKVSAMDGINGRDRVRNGRFLAQGRRSASSLRTPRGLTIPARIRSIPLCGDVDAADIRMPLHRFVGTIRRNKHRDDRALGRLQNSLAQNDVRAGEPSRRWEARWNKWKGQHVLDPETGKFELWHRECAVEVIATGEGLNLLQPATDADAFKCAECGKPILIIRRNVPGARVPGYDRSGESGNAEPSESM